jgi:hypothetical protein
MKRKRSEESLTYNTEEEAYLVYRGNQARYAKAVVSAELPVGNASLLCQLTDFLSFIEDLTDAVYARVAEEDEEEEEDDETRVVDYAKMITESVERMSRGEVSGVTRPTVHTVTMLGVAWRWHNEVCERGTPSVDPNAPKPEAMTGLYAHCFFLSWTAFCKLFHLVIYENRELYHSIGRERADQYLYCKMVGEKENVIISDSPLLAYTVNEVWYSLQQIVPSLYCHAFTLDMKTYLYALFFRYCDLFCTRQGDLMRVMNNPLFVKLGRPGPGEGSEEGGSSFTGEDSEDVEEDTEEDSEDSEEEEEEEDEEAYDAYKSTTVALSDTHSLRSAYFFEGQLAFFSQLKRVLLSERLAQLAEEDPLILAEVVSEADMAECREALTEAVQAVALHKELKQFVKEDYKAAVVSLYVYHGETERYRMRWPHASAQAVDVLGLLRPDANVVAMRAHGMTAKEILTDQVLYEKETVLLAKCTTLRWLCYQKERHAIKPSVAEASKLEQCFMLEELVSLAQIDEMVASLSQVPGEDEEEAGVPIPTLLRLVRQYYVIRGTSIYRTADFAEAFLLWLSLLVEEGVILRKNIHPKLKSCLSLFLVT